MKELLEAQDQTILKMVNEVFKSEIFKDGKLPCPSEDPVEEGSEIITTANEYEQAILFTAKKLMEKKDKISTGTEVKALRNLFWASIKSRISCDSLFSYGLALKKDWQITGFEREDCDIRIHCLELY